VHFEHIYEIEYYFCIVGMDVKTAAVYIEITVLHGVQNQIRILPQAKVNILAV